MTKRMLIDASHPEETRVVVVNDAQLEDFDFETADKKQLKGNIYLAKVTRVEPSLQAAFVDYGGNRHGFLAFSEIHPDYYQIPMADRRALEEQQRAEAEARADTNGAGDEGEPGPEARSPENGDGESAEPVAEDPEEEAAEVFDEQARRRSRLLRSYKIQEVIRRRQIMLVQVVKEERGNKGAALTTYLSLAGRYCVLMPNTARGGGISRKIANTADRSRLKSIARDLEVPDGMGLIIRTAGQQRNKQEIRRDYEYLLRLWSDIRELTLKSIAPCVIHEEGALVQRAIRDLYARDVDEVLVEGEGAYRTAKKVMSMLMPSRARRVKLYREEEEEPLFYRYKVEDRLDAMHSPVIQLRSGGSIVIHATEALTAIDVNSGRATRERNIEETALKTNLEAADEVARQLRLRDLAGLVVVDFIDMSENRNQRAVERRFRDALKLDRARVQLGRISMFGLLELSRQRLRPSFQELSSQPCPACMGSGVVRSTGSSALQALRGIEREGIKGEAARIAITLPLDSALYLLNQKRGRLMALEQRYGMATEVLVSRDLIAGQFEIERLERRAAEAAPAAAEAAPAEAASVEGPAPAADAAQEADGQDRKRRRRRRRRRRGEDGAVEAEVRAAAPANGGGDRADQDRMTAEPAPQGAEARGGETADLPLPESPDDGVAAMVAADDEARGDADAAVDAATPAPPLADGDVKPARRRRSRARRRPGEDAADDAATAGDDAAMPSAGAPAATAATAGDRAESEETPSRARRPSRRRRRSEAPAEEGEPAVAAQPELDASAPVVPAPAPAPQDDAARPSASAAAANGADGGHQGAEAEGGAGAGSDVEAEERDQEESESAAAPGEEPGEPSGPPRRGWWSRFVRQ